MVPFPRVIATLAVIIGTHLLTNGFLLQIFFVVNFLSSKKVVTCVYVSFLFLISLLYDMFNIHEIKIWYVFLVI